MRFALVDEGPLTARMNPSLAGSVVANLLKNAFVHGDEGGEVTVRVARVASRSATAVRAVRSTPGVSSTGSIRERRRRVLRGWALPWSTQSAVSTG